MTTAADILRVAGNEVGYVEGGGSDGRSGNITKYWAELQPSFQGASWCAAFVSWVWKHAGHPLPAIDHPWGYSLCADAVNWAKKNGLWSASGHYQPGDIIFFDWASDGHADHTGIVVSDDGVHIQTIEGNTSGTDAGSQRNGGGVYRRIRTHGSTTLGVLSSHKWLSTTAPHAPAPAPHPAPRPVKHNPYPPAFSKYGDRGNNVKFAQWAAGCPVDGVFGPQTKHAVVVFQQHYPACGGADGIVGPKTVAVMKNITH